MATLRALPAPDPRDEACMECFIHDLRARASDPKTIDAYASDVNIFREAVTKNLIDIEAEDIYRVIAQWQAQNVSVATVQRRAAALRQFYNLLYTVGLISIRPTALLRVPKPWKRIQAAPNEDLELVILSIGKESPFDLRDRAVLLLLRDTGIRANAIATSELANVDWKRGRIMLRDDKYGKDHWVPLSKRSLEALHQYVQTSRPHFLRGRNIPNLFASPKSLGPITRQRIWQIADKWSMKVLGRRQSPHDWRRAVLTEGAEKGMELFDLMQMAGHVDPTTTQRYLQHSTAKLREVFYRTHPRRKDTQ